MLDRIPNPLPEQLRRGSPVTGDDGIGSGVIFGLPGYDPGRPNNYGINWLFVLHTSQTPPALDLRDATGRAHLAAWLRPQTDALLSAARHLSIGSNERERLVAAALHYRDMTPTEIDTLARLALRVMGREQ